jgi:hypothetical protein
MMRIGFGLNHDAEDSRPAHLNRSSGGTQVNQMVPDIVRIGVTNARIKCVTPQRVEYRDEAGQECFVDLDTCLRIPVHFYYEKEGNLALWTSEGSDSRCVARRSSHDHPPEWVEFTNKRRTRFEFRSYKEACNILLQPLRKAGWYTQMTRAMKP